MTEEKEKIKVIVDADTYLELLETKMKAKDYKARLAVMEDKIADAYSYARSFKEEKEKLEHRIEKALEMLEDIFTDDDEDVNNIKGVLDGTRVIINSANITMTGTDIGATNITKKEVENYHETTN